MTLTVIAGGRHASRVINARLRRENSELKADKRQLTVNAYRREDEIHEALLRGCQDAMLIAQLRAENTSVKAANEELRRETVKAKADTLRAQAEQERLRRAVINARPRIHKVPTDLVRPFAPVVCLPYTSPVAYVDTSSEQTQELPVLDWPKYPATH